MFKSCSLEKMFWRDLFSSLPTKLSSTSSLTLPRGERNVKKSQKLEKLKLSYKGLIAISNVSLRLNVVDCATFVNVILK